MFCKICRPVFEKAKIKTNGNGTNNAKAGRGGSLLKSEKNSFNDNMVSKLIQTAIINKAVSKIFLCLAIEKPAPIVALFRPCNITAIQIKVNASQRKPAFIN
jgi:hypothetical protein